MKTFRKDKIWIEIERKPISIGGEINEFVEEVKELFPNLQKDDRIILDQEIDYDSNYTSAIRERLENDDEFEQAKLKFELLQIKRYEAVQKAKETKAKKLAEKLAKMSEEERLEREEYERLKKKYK